MTKVRKVKRRKTYKVNINRKRLRNKLRKVPTITCPQIKNAWDAKKSTKTNLVQMGLAYDPNKALKIPNIKGELIKTAKQKATGELSDSEEMQKPLKKNPKKLQVAQELEAEAKAPRERMFRLPKGQAHFLTYLMDKYGDDYKAMSRDKKNYYQLTWKQIRQKINVFKGIPEQYAEYLLQKGDIVLEDPTPLEETKKKIAEENMRKHCAPKKSKKKSIVGQWIEESIEEETDEKDAFDTLETIQDGDENEKNKKRKKNSAEKSSEGEKKLKLFSDDENDGENRSSKPKIIKKTKIDSNRTDNTKERAKLLEKLASSDSEDSEELEGDDNEVDFKNLSDMSEDQLSEDDVLDDGEFVTDSDEESD